MPGKIVRIIAQENQLVQKGEALLIMEAMKMEHTIRAPYTGIIKTIFYQVGEQVEEKAELISIQKASN